MKAAVPFRDHRMSCERLFMFRLHNRYRRLVWALPLVLMACAPAPRQPVDVGDSSAATAVLVGAGDIAQCGAAAVAQSRAWQTAA